VYGFGEKSANVWLVNSGTVQGVVAGRGTVGSAVAGLDEPMVSAMLGAFKETRRTRAGCQRESRGSRIMRGAPFEGISGSGAPGCRPLPIRCGERRKRGAGATYTRSAAGTSSGVSSNSGISFRIGGSGVTAGIWGSPAGSRRREVRKPVASITAAAAQKGKRMSTS
jgi:hypothetical protein